MSFPESAGPDVDAQPSTPALEVVAGEPNAEELAALVAVLTAVAQPGVAQHPEEVRVDSWAAPWRGIGAPVPLGPGAWSAGSIG